MSPAIAMLPLEEKLLVVQLMGTIVVSLVAPTNHLEDLPAMALLWDFLAPGDSARYT